MITKTVLTPGSLGAGHVYNAATKQFDVAPSTGGLPPYTVADSGAVLTVAEDGASVAWRKYLTTSQLAPVIDNTVTVPPPTPSGGDSYIVPTGATGVWASNVNTIATWDGVSAWDYYTPACDDVTFVQSGVNIGKSYRYDCPTASWLPTVTVALPETVDGYVMCENDSIETNTGGAFIKDGAVYGWGDRGLGINGSTAEWWVHSIPTSAYSMSGSKLSFSPMFTKVWFSQNNVFALSGDSDLFISGYNSGRQLGSVGNPAFTTSTVLSALTLNPAIRAGGWKVKSLEFPVGIATTVPIALVTTDGKLVVWGFNTSGQLGVGNTATQTVPVEVVVPNASGVKEAKFTSTAGTTMYVLCNDGTLYASGNNTGGKFGIGNETGSSSLVQVNTGVKTVKPFQTSCLVVKNDGTVWGTGSNTYKHLGIGSLASTTSWVQATGVTSASNIYTNEGVTCPRTILVDTSGVAYVAGYSSTLYPHGNNLTTNIDVFTALTPSQAPFQGLVKSAVLCGSTTPTSYILTTSGEVYSAGANELGSRGVGNITAPTNTNGLGLWRKVSINSPVFAIRGGGLDDSATTEAGLALITARGLFTVGAPTFRAKGGDSAANYTNPIKAYEPY